MQKLFYFFYRYRAFLFFLVLEIICFTFIVNHNSYHSSAFFTTSNRYVAEVLQTTNNVSDYFRLKTVNEELARENAQLRYQLTVEKNIKSLFVPNTSDYLRTHQYKFFPAKVINNSTGRFTNYLTLNKGKLDGVKPGMGVLSSRGVVGRVKTCSDHFATVTSLLHDRFQISSKIKSGNIDGFVKWNGKSPRFANLHFVARHHKIRINDTVVTSGYNALFPEGIMIGTIKDFEIDHGEPFYKINVQLSTDFTRLGYVYLIDNALQSEKDSLELQTESN